MKTLFFYCAVCILTLVACSNQPVAINGSIAANDSVIVGGECEGCEAIYETPVAFEELDYTDTLPDYFEPGPKLLVTGTVYKPGGKTPAANVVVYIYHTDQKGIYSTKGNETGWGKRHGYIRGWIKTNERGEYKFYTLKPAAYPGREIPAHIHATIKEHGINEYWIDEFLFDDDPLLTATERKKCEDRCGSGIIKLQNKNGMLVAERNIILGLNIPNYPG
jgi:protocatechuate 3,4-dioxygenase beta subunit